MAEHKRMRWTDKKRKKFLDHLAATCNVSASAAATGVRLHSVYDLRRRDPRFAEEWREALELGYQMLEMRLVGHALAGKGTTDALAHEGLGPIDAHLALTMLTTHRNALAGIANRRGLKPRRATEEETNAALMKKLDAVERRMRGDQE